MSQCDWCGVEIDGKCTTQIGRVLFNVCDDCLQLYISKDYNAIMKKAENNVKQSLTAIQHSCI